MLEPEEDSESQLQRQMRKLAFDLLDTAREMQEASGGEFEDINDCIFRMRSIATLLVGYAPQPIPQIKGKDARRVSVFNPPKKPSESAYQQYMRQYVQDRCDEIDGAEPRQRSEVWGRH